ncbi:ScbR family autoregulator-binding transcription factor [Streptomyces sp. NPDC020807]|uniref:ScbR family autoregulator-binding transcription factor n=1 Tax=Streptomyces sp. NPDC020807 TaxID=3155119 RepID=UPI0033EB3C66
MVKQERAERTLRRIISGAAEQFERNGYFGTSLDDITRAAGVSKGAFYFHFSSKEQVAAAVMEIAEGRFEDVMTDAPCGDTVSPLQHLIDITHRLNRLLHEEPVVRAAVRLQREWPEDEPVRFDHYRIWHETAQKHFALAADRSELRENAPKNSACALASATLFSLEGFRRPNQSTDETEQRLADLWDVLLPAITPGDVVDAYRTSPPEGCVEPELSHQG